MKFMKGRVERLVMMLQDPMMEKAMMNMLVMMRLMMMVKMMREIPVMKRIRVTTTLVICLLGIGSKVTMMKLI
uniref:Uncharacterized protein n=1 Tax=Arundo donax TaxID=35708 RepID=A0A0A9ESM0_ARUDO